MSANGVSSEGWHADAKNLLRVPQQLNTFLQLKAAGVEEPGPTYQAMLESVWLTYVQKPAQPRLAQLAYLIAEMMAEREELGLAVAHFDDWVDELNALIAANILTPSPPAKIGFSHQTVFDHVLARSFVKKDGGLFGYVATRMDSLFVRPKVLAALQYLRDTERTAYEREFKAIWSYPNLRAHLRYLLIDFLGSQALPTAQEELDLVGAFGQPELRPIVLKAIATSSGWFDRLATNVIAQAMSDSALADLCLPSLQAGWETAPGIVTKLLSQRWLGNERHDQAILIVLRQAPAWTNELLHIAETVLRRAAFSSHYIEGIVATIGVDSPELAIRMMRWHLDGELARRTEVGVERARVRQEAVEADSTVDRVAFPMPVTPVSDLVEDGHGWGTAPALAELLPALYVEQLWPWYLQAFETMANLLGGAKRHLGYALSYTADLRFDGEANHGLPVPGLLDAITVALEQLAERSPVDFEQWAHAQETVHLTPVHRLLAHAASRNPEQLAGYALRYLLADEQRYLLGTSSDPWCTTATMVSVCAPYWSEEDVRSFSDKVKAFAPRRPHEQTHTDFIRFWPRIVRRTRLAMLRALPANARTRDVQRNVDEESRVFPGPVDPNESQGGFIGSPIDAEQLLRASPADIAKAFRKIPDKADWDHPTDFMRGGNVQLSQAFGVAAKMNPAHAVTVLPLLEPSFGERAVAAVIQALANIDHDPQALMALILELHGRGFGAEPDGHFRQAAAQAINSLLGQQICISDGIIQMLEGWLSREARPLDNNGPVGSSDDAIGRFLLSGHQAGRGFDDPEYTIVRDIIYARYGRDEVPQVLALLRRYLAGPYSIQVWEGVMDHLGPIAMCQPPEGRRFIGELLSALPVLDGKQGPAVLMARTHAVALEEVTANLQRWRDSDLLSARKGYGELTALLALVNPKAEQAREWLAELIRDPRLADARQGAAATAVNLLWLEPQYRADATRLLLGLISHNEAEVWQQLYELFSITDKLEREPYTLGILEAIASNIEVVPVPQTMAIVERVGTLLPHHAQLVARLALGLIQRWRVQLSDLSSPLGTTGQALMDLALTVHGTNGTKLEGLAMFEQLVEIDAYQARETLDEIDRRVRPGVPPRRRLPRRVHQPRKVKRDISSRQATEKLPPAAS